MNDQDIQVFITGVRRYFESLRADIRVVIEPPFIKDEEKPFLEYTGIIGISGKTHAPHAGVAKGGIERPIGEHKPIFERFYHGMVHQGVIGRTGEFAVV